MVGDPETDTAPSSAVADLARSMLALRRFGLIATSSVASSVGADYTDNAVVVTLATIDRCGTVRPKELERHLGLSSPNVSRILDRLEASGDVTRHAGRVSSDRRAVVLRLTPAGRRRVRAMMEGVFADSAEIALVAKEAVAHLDELADEPSVPRSTPEIGETRLTERFGRLGLQLQAVLGEAAGDVSGALALCALYLEGGVGRPTTIADRVGLTSGGTTKVIDRLESAGLVERSFGTDEDRRVVVVELSHEGRRRLGEIADATRAHLPEVRRQFELVIALLEQRSG